MTMITVCLLAAVVFYALRRKDYVKFSVKAPGVGVSLEAGGSEETTQNRARCSYSLTIA